MLHVTSVTSVTRIQRPSLKYCISGFCPVTDFRCVTRHERSNTKSQLPPQLSYLGDFQCVTRHKPSETKSQLSPQLSCVADFQCVTRHKRSETKSKILQLNFAL